LNNPAGDPKNRSTIRFGALQPEGYRALVTDRDAVRGQYRLEMTRAQGRTLKQ
jgi:hypothetical protein